MKKRIVSVLMSVAMIAALTACSGESSNDSGSKKDTETGSEEKILGAGIYSASDNFNSYIGKAISNACKGVFTTNIEDGQNDQSTQNNQVDTMLAKGASAVAVSVCV